MPSESVSVEVQASSEESIARDAAASIEAAIRVLRGGGESFERIAWLLEDVQHLLETGQSHSVEEDQMLPPDVFTEALPEALPAHL